jgi:hypothetical protein
MSEASGVANIVNFEVLGRHVSDASRADYLCRSATLWRAYIKMDADPTHVGFAEWLLSRKPELRGSTWRLYRRAAEYWLSTVDAPQAARDILRDDATNPVVETLPRRKAARRTSALKQKRIPEEDFQKLFVYLKVFCKSENAGLALQWLHAAILTGARPCEWSASRLAGTRLTLATAKFSTWRCLGESRTLDLSGLSATEMAVVAAMVEAGQTMGEHGTYELMQERVSAVLYQACRRLWPRGDRHYPLYSARHQANSNAKGGLPLREVSAILGHSSTRTASRSYGRRKAAWDPEVRPAPPVPASDDVDRVRSVPSAVYRRVPKEDLGGNLPITPHP